MTLRTLSAPLFTALLFSSLVWASPLHAAEAVKAAAPELDGVALLGEVGAAQRATNYRGRFVYVRANRTESMQVVHALIDGTEYERLSHLDNTSTEIIRRGEDVVFVHPDARQTRVEANVNASPFRQFAELGPEFARHYVVTRAGQSRVAGRAAERVAVQPRDAHRFGYRLWIDQASRLLLRYEVVNGKGLPMEAVEFVDLETGIEIPKALFEAPAGTSVGAMTVARDAAAVPPVAPGWLPPGFRRTGHEMRRIAGQDAPVSTQSYSDGLAVFSLFVEQAAADAKPMGRQVGPTVAVSGVLSAGANGRFLVTLVGEVPPPTAIRIVESTRHGVAPGAGK